MNKKLHILHLEDSQTDAEIIQEKLLKGGLECEITLVEAREEFVATIEQGGFDVILSGACIWGTPYWIQRGF